MDDDEVVGAVELILAAFVLAVIGFAAARVVRRPGQGGVYDQAGPVDCGPSFWDCDGGGGDC